MNRFMALKSLAIQAPKILNLDTVKLLLLKDLQHEPLHGTKEPSYLST